MARGKDIRGFSADLDKFAKKVGVDTHTAVKKLALDIFSDIVHLTPVDTGYAQVNWFISIGRRVGGITPGGKRASFRRKSGGSASANAIGRAAAKVEEANPGQVIWLQNNVPYIQMLEAGSSKQAPSGMVALSLVNWKERLRRFLV